MSIVTIQEDISNAVNMNQIEIQKHPVYSSVLYVQCPFIGRFIFTDSVETAATDGMNVLINPLFFLKQNPKQRRYILLHEDWHKIKFDTHPMYAAYVALYGHAIVNMAQDFSNDSDLRLMDKDFGTRNAFIEYPDVGEGRSVLDDPKYDGMSFQEIILAFTKKDDDTKNKIDPETGDLINQDTGEKVESYDQHDPLPVDADDVESIQAHADAIQNAAADGEMMSSRMKRSAGLDETGSPLSYALRKRPVDYKSMILEFMQETTKGYDRETYLPSDVLFQDHIMPTYYNESAANIGIFCDSSYSMNDIMGIVVGQVENICKQIPAKKIQVLWWDDSVEKQQEFKAGKFKDVVSDLEPTGGGGTNPCCVVDYVKLKQYKFDAVIWITDGYFYYMPDQLAKRVLWCVIDNPRFKAPHGKVVHIKS